MFTGLIHEIGTLTGIRQAGAVTRLSVRAPKSVAKLELGDSLAVNGICLTVTGCRADTVALDAVAETRRVTTLASWRTGQRVHLEPALRAGDAMGGHLVLGHVDAVGELRRSVRRGENLLLSFSIPEILKPWLLPKGSIAIDGVSLTLDAGPFRDVFTVSLIPHTLGWTLFESLRSGQKVNLEADVLAKGAAARNEATAAVTPRTASRSLTIDDIRARGFRRSGRRR
jgi:riboflavin synthase